MALLQEKVSLTGAWLDNLTVGIEAIYRRRTQASEVLLSVYGRSEL